MNVRRLTRGLVRSAKYGAFVALLPVVLIGMNSDVINISPAERVSLQHKYNLAQWEALNIPDKWVHIVASKAPWAGNDVSDRAVLDRYFHLGEEIADARRQMEELAARNNVESLDGIAGYHAQLDDLKVKREAVRNEAEEIVESYVTTAARGAGLGNRFGLVFPPTDVRLTDPPKILIVSPRDHIARQYEVLLKADTSLADSDAMEDRLLAEEDLAGLVIDIGGIATFPASIVNTMPMRETLQVASHEWMHHYLFFRPLGQKMFSSGEMMTLNETFADMVGRELGDQVFIKLGGHIPPVVESAATTTPAATHDPSDFNYDREMRITRELVDDLLEHGQYIEAEAYMEGRRQVFVAHGYNIRKLNQAFFAFHGTYAEGAESSSPIGPQMSRLHMLIPDLNTFVKTMEGVKSYDEFLAILEIAENGALAEAVPTVGP